MKKSPMIGLRRIAALGLGLAMVGGLSVVAAAPATAATATPAPGYSITGTVNLNTSDGTVVPADGATVTDTNDPSHVATTKADGTFALTGLSDGDYNLDVSKDGYVTANTDATIAGADTPLPASVTLDAVPAGDPQTVSYSITGTVTGKDAKPGFAPTVEMDENLGYSNTQLTLDSTGQYSFPNLQPNANVTLTFSADGFQTVTKNVDISAADAKVNVELLPTPPALAGGTVKISGDPVVGNVLTVATSGWPTGTKLSYEWYWNGGQMGGPIDGVTGTSYKVATSEVGRLVGVLVTGSKDGFTSTTVRGELKQPVTAAAKPAAKAPAGDTGGLSVYLKERGVTTQAQATAGLPAGDLNPGEDYKATLTWTAADSYVDVYLYSTPTLVGTFPVVNGVAQITLSATVLSELDAGSHTLVVTGQSSGAVQAVAVSVANVLASTGFSAGGPLAVAVLLLLLGGALLVVRRRRLHA